MDNGQVVTDEAAGEETLRRSEEQLARAENKPMYADIDALFRPRLSERDVPTAAGMVRVRALSRLEARNLRDRHGDDGEFETALIAAAMVRPAMTLEQVRMWEAAWPAGEFNDLSQAVQDLSKLSKAAAKSDLR